MTPSLFQSAVCALWILWFIIWWISARQLKATRWKESLISQLGHRVPLVFAYLLLFTSRYYWPVWLRTPFLSSSFPTRMAGTIVVAAGLGFSVWARFYLGSNWSRDVTLKQDHTLIRTGPYRFIRHPIYMGMLAGLLGTTIVVGEWRGILGLGLALLALVYKSRVEEGRLREAFSEYQAYCRKTAALIPFVY